MNKQKKNTIIIFIFLGILLCPFISFSQSVTKLRVMTYNIMNGYDWGKDTARERAAASFIASQHPDVVALQELCGFTGTKLKEFAKKWGHQYTVLLKEDGYPVGLTSNKPITVITKIMHDGFGHGMLHVVSDGVHFFIIHLNPGNYRMRLKESELIRNYMRQILTDKDSLYMVLGDFNSHSPFDVFLDKKRPMLLAQRQSEDSTKNENSTTLMDNHYAYSVVASFLGYPLVDLCEGMMKPENLFSFPTPILIGTWLKPGEVVPTRERLDYILTSPKLAKMCSFATIINSGVVDKLSDHFPVVADFELK